MIRFLFLFPVLLFSFSATGQTLTDDQKEALTKRLMQYIPEGGPGGALGVIMDGKIVYENYGGLADLDAQRPIGPETVFNIASNGKQFTAICALQLAREGKIDLADDIRRYFPGLYPGVEEPITIHHLITHTSGVRDVYSLWSLQGVTWWKQTLNNRDALALLADQRELNFTSGSRHSYSNANYILLAELVAKASGKSFREYSSKLFADLGMTNSVFLDDHTQTMPTVARPYFNFDTWQTYDWLPDVVGDGAMFSTLPDQLRWESAVMNGTPNKASGELIAASQGLIDEAVTSYGYGLEHGKYRGVPVTFHDGSTGAWKASFMRFPEHNLAIVALNNSGKFGTQRLVYDVADILLEQAFTKPRFLKEPETVAEEIPLEELLGTYRNDNGFYFRFVSRNGKVFLERHERNPVEIELERGNVYHEIADEAFKQEFTRHEEGKLQVTAYYRSHAPYTLTRAESNWENYDYRGLNGSFRNDEVGLELSVRYQDNGKYLVEIFGDKLKGTLLSPDEMKVQNMKLTAVRNEAGVVNELRLKNGSRVLNLRCERVTK